MTSVKQFLIVRVLVFPTRHRDLPFFDECRHPIQKDRHNSLVQIGANRKRLHIHLRLNVFSLFNSLRCLFSAHHLNGGLALDPKKLERRHKQEPALSLGATYLFGIGSGHCQLKKLKTAYFLLVDMSRERSQVRMLERNDFEGVRQRPKQLKSVSWKRCPKIGNLKLSSLDRSQAKVWSV